MEHFKNLEQLSLELDTSKGKILLLADPHLAFELSRGLRIRTYFERELAEFIKSKEPDFVMLLGDVKEPLGLKTYTKKILLEFFSTLEDFEILITKGNHDGKIEEIEREFKNVKVAEYFLIDNALFIHGNQRLPEIEFERAYLGHIHPAVRIKFGSAVKKAKCFLRVRNFLILPTINPYIEGFDVRQGIRMIPFLKSAKKGKIFLPDGTYLGEVSF
ncbi:metallophosphoesterase [Palaeococcus sp. (in: euryarchaeotes)]